jgi:hypothetical protein
MRNISLVTQNRLAVLGRVASTVNTDFAMVSGVI